MKRRMLSLLLVMVMVLGMLPTIAFAAPIESSGVYQIGTAEELLWFAQEVNGGNTGISGVLTADIDMSAVANWPGIGTATNMFAGSFDGQGHTVTFTDADWGLFGYVTRRSLAKQSLRRRRWRWWTLTAMAPSRKQNIRRSIRSTLEVKK